jgi:hypothetical protein
LVKNNFSLKEITAAKNFHFPHPSESPTAPTLHSNSLYAL